MCPLALMEQETPTRAFLGQLFSTWKYQISHFLIRSSSLIISAIYIPKFIGGMAY